MRENLNKLTLILSDILKISFIKKIVKNRYQSNFKMPL